MPIYSDEEIGNHYEYYKDRNWLQNETAKLETGKDELIFLSGRNPSQFRRVCGIV